MAGTVRDLVRWASCCWFLLHASSLAAQTDHWAPILRYRVAGAGLENVAVVVDRSDVIVSYENNVYRDDIRAAEKVLEVLVSEPVPAARYVLLPRKRNMSTSVILVPAEAARAFLEGRIDGKRFASEIDVRMETGEFRKRLRGARAGYGSLLKLDLVVRPLFQAEFGNFGDPVRSRVGLVPEVRTRLWPGMTLSGQVVVPVQDELNPDAEAWSPGVLTLNQMVRLPAATFLSLTLGRFTEERWGGDLEWRTYLLNGQLSVGGNVGYTGESIFERGVWHHTRPELLTWTAGAEYRVPTLATTLRADYGSFLFGDRGWRAGLVREFGEMEIGFFLLETDRELNGGLILSIPLLPGRALSLERIRLRPARAFRWEYRYHGFPTNGIRYRTYQTIDDLISRTRPDHIRYRFRLRVHESNTPAKGVSTEDRRTEGTR